MITSLKYYEGKIVVYFKQKNSLIRYKIIKIDKKQLDRTFHVKQEVLNSKATNQLIDEMHQKVDTIISNCKAQNKIHLLSKDYIDYHLNILDKTELSVQVNELSYIIPLYEKFLKRKLIELLNKQGYQHIDESLSIEEIRQDKSIKDETRSIKDYISTLNLLKDYQSFTDDSIRIKDLNKAFLSKLHSFAASDRDSKKFKTRKQSDKTFKKRLDCLAEFYRFLDKKFDFKLDEDNINYRVAKRDSNIIIFDEEELKQLLSIDFSDCQNKNWEKIRDIMVFLSMTGMRYSDLVTLNKERDLVIFDNVYTIIKNAVKTRNRFEVPLNKRAMEIWKKYDFNFKPTIPNQVFNKEIKELLKHFRLLNNKVLIIKYFRGKEFQNMEEKNLHISSHTGRRTFISNCVKKNVPINRIMSMTGHRKVDTLTIYFERWGKKTSEYVDLINI
ncbi:MAG TPA: tyrosine-type recombinase/integrase [Tenuifilaceae bacterium]|nr:tyrosine-type recombinase/integrase [Tenuifilaceae bacterium]HPN21578.1 tyrosine-type recombinase/integrase [Tenuifilaceae bacterium]